ncbi:MAG: OB-fold domain-containing protein [Candidatus Binataceae bacterium]
MNGQLAGSVYSHTLIRVPGRAHAHEPPFLILLVELEDGARVLGRFDGNGEAPGIGARVAETGRKGNVPLFSRQL